MEKEDEKFNVVLDAAINDGIISVEDISSALQVLQSTVEFWRKGENCPNSATQAYIVEYIENRKGLKKEFNLAAFLGEAEAAGVSLDDIANEFGYAVSTVYRWRDQVSRPHPSLIPKIIEGVNKMIELKLNP